MKPETVGIKDVIHDKKCKSHFDEMFTLSTLSRPLHDNAQRDLIPFFAEPVTLIH